MDENTVDTTDRISMLPYSIVHHILSYLLDDPISCVRVSVLSKEWFALTASCPFLYFHLNWVWSHVIFGKYWNEYIVDKFCKYVEHTVSRFCKQNISAHTLDISAKMKNLEQIEIFERCLVSVIEKGVQVLVIDVEYWDKNLPMFRLPNTLLSASSLTSLTLNKCELPSSLMVGIVKFKSLKLLSLTKLSIDEGVIEYLTKSCPILEVICLKYCYGFKTFCVQRHHNLQKVEIYYRSRLERIDVDAPNLGYFLLENDKDKAPYMSLASCTNLQTLFYHGFPTKSFSDFLSNFSFIETLSIKFSSHNTNLKLSNHFLFLRILQLPLDYDLEEIDLNAPNLHFFEYSDRICSRNFAKLLRKDSSVAKRCMKCHTQSYLDFQKLRHFLDKNSTFKVLELDINLKLVDVEELKLIQSPPYKLEHVELEHTYDIRESSIYIALVDAVLWCCRPRSLTLVLYHFTGKGDVVKYTYEKLLQQEDEGQTNIKFSLIYFCKDDEQHFSDLNSLLKALSLDQLSCKITFIKEEARLKNVAGLTDGSGCTTFDEIAARVYRSWVKAFDVKALDFELRLTFSVNTRSKFKYPPLKEGFHGNVVCVACVTGTVSGLVSRSLQDVTRLFRDARLRISEDYIMIYRMVQMLHLKYQ
ncbi:F-box domain, Leucine-rich repeat domain, L domain-like protein [Artemisia annua]|uniref:F-box domain, Leucine-rich repeat domain, L domain-like protein n=1 Tax=Artemisia annua TaxID=35608 RepID=A0A2U1LWF2_ARTAN|nr:F-box domain, Leucine-rich repeat domain, L domain-like protein [Artemisia annua]